MLVNVQFPCKFEAKDMYMFIGTYEKGEVLSENGSHYGKDALLATHTLLRGSPQLVLISRFSALENAFRPSSPDFGHGFLIIDSTRFKCRLLIPIRT